MSKSKRNTRTAYGRQRHISVRAVRRESPDLRRLGRAIVAIALAQAEADAEAQAAAAASPTPEGVAPKSEDDGVTHA